LNGEFMKRQGASFADRLLAEAGKDSGKQIRRGYEQALARAPTKRELQIAIDFLKRQTTALRGIRSRLTFRPDVPNSLSVEYMKQLAAPDFLIGPRTDWTYQRGRWSAAYEGIRTMERWRGPFALWTGERFEDGAIEAGVVLHTAAEFGSVLLRATGEGDEQRGYEVTLDPRQQRVILRRHSGELVTLAEADAAIPTGRAIPLRIELAGSRIRVWMNGDRDPIIDATDPNPVKGDGFLGVRTWGAALSVDGLTLLAHGKKVEVARGRAASNSSVMTQHDGTDGPGSDEQREGLQAFCLLLFNLNELVYVD